MEYYGFAGKILYVDLTTGSIKKEPLDLGVARAFLGGGGIDLKLAYDLLAPGTDPLSPENPLIIGVSSLIGTIIPSAAKVTLVTKRPNYASAVEEDKHAVTMGKSSFSNTRKLTKIPSSMYAVGLSAFNSYHYGVQEKSNSHENPMCV